VSNAKEHLKSKFVLNVDIKDFFPSITFRRVRGMLLAKPFGFTNAVATSLARLSCHQDQLPQGAPSSPVIANMICRRLDQQMKELCKSLDCWYTRYADDISISSRVKEFPSDLAYLVKTAQATKTVPGGRLTATFEANGFTVQAEKTRLAERDSRQVVTGVIVNRKLNLEKKRKSQVRAMLHAWKTHGYTAAETEFYSKYDHKHRPRFKLRPDFKRVVGGRIAYLSMILGKAHPLVVRFRAQLAELPGAPKGKQ
jgi:RNA-directed DNA polymerase